MHPEMLHQYLEVRHAELLRDADAARLAKLAQGNQPNRAKKFVNKLVAFAKGAGAKSAETTQTVEVPQIEWSGEQP